MRLNTAHFSLSEHIFVIPIVKKLGNADKY